MQFTNLNFLSVIIFLIIGIIIVFLAYKKFFTQKKFNEKYQLLSSEKNFFIKYIFLFLSLLIILFSIFGIKISGKKVVNKVSGIDIMFVLDVSKSMNVADVTDNNYAYTRLDVAKSSIAKYVASHPNDRFGLVIFAGDAISTIPLTTDHDLFLTFLEGVDYKNLVKQGSDFNKALKLAISRFVGDKDKGKALVFISDGGDEDTPLNPPLQEGDITDIAFFVVGVGTEKGGRIIKGINAFGEYIYQKYKGNYVISKLNRKNLRKIAKILSGEYFEIKRVGDLYKLDKKINNLEKKAIVKNTDNKLTNFSRNLTIFSFIFFMVFIFLYIRKNSE